ncbi:phosphocarrier protein HPr [Mycolicibacterium insubricum]|uniref:Phosphocarrier protein HPr n=1 Tax=Mycolicibacterium insubricum TaxID=444597 RepID=A0A1X0CVL5_9MYCO|nr:HPr family phosphocarrier protein [Mycolicibacterium insubricum]MCB9439591.1 HPr family phosphocarrier protein [Mycolicibacterium sp.]ORA64207.1 HPr family phosphocarrier protein [Mycolicibacterium insubricum]BBZ65311.1 phosphocarrier protein HPr [Mycolicibacterium insubricum]
MPSKTVAVGSAVGLHARPAAIIADAVTTSGAEVTVSCAGGAPVDAGSALMLMTLGAAKGTEVTVCCQDPALLERIAGLIAGDLDAG